jgi:hypothetical protein
LKVLGSSSRAALVGESTVLAPIHKPWRARSADAIAAEREVDWLAARRTLVRASHRGTRVWEWDEATIYIKALRVDRDLNPRAASVGQRIAAAKHHIRHHARFPPRAGTYAEAVVPRVDGNRAAIGTVPGFANGSRAAAAGGKES